MGCGEKGTVWSDESAGSNGDETRIEKGAVKVYIHALSDSTQYTLPHGQGRKEQTYLKLVP